MKKSSGSELDNRSFRKGMEAGKEKILECLANNKLQLPDEEIINNVAKIACNGDDKMTELISKAYNVLGSNGTITVKKTKNVTDSLEIVKGMSFNRSYSSPYFVTNPAKLEMEYEEALLFISAETIRVISPIIPILEYAMKQGKPIIIVANVEGDALKALINNKIQGRINVGVVTPPSVGVSSKAYLKDLAVLSGANVVDIEEGICTPTNFDPEKDLGEIDSIKTTKATTTIVVNHPDKEAVEKRVLQIKGELEKESCTEYEAKKLNERIAKITTGIGVIKVGGHTESEVMEKKDRYDDGVAAVKSALEEGVIIGGGVPYFLAAGSKTDHIGQNDSFYEGFTLITDIVASLFFYITEGASSESIKTMEEMNITAGSYRYGINPFTKEIEDFVTNGIIDSFKGIRLSLETAVSIAITLLSTEVILVDEYIHEG